MAVMLNNIFLQKYSKGNNAALMLVNNIHYIFLPLKIQKRPVLAGMLLMLLTFCVGTVQEIKVVVGCLVSPFLFCPLGILFGIDCSYGNCVLT